MTRTAALLVAAALLAACNKQPDAPATEVNQPLNEDSVNAKARSIEEAADEAAKLIEADAKAEIDAAKAHSEGGGTAE